MSSFASDTVAAEELLSQLVSEGYEFSQEIAEASHLIPLPPEHKHEVERELRFVDRQSKLRSLLTLHRDYPRLVSLFYACKKFSCSSSYVKVLEEEEVEYLESLTRLRNRTRALQLPQNLQIKLDEFMSSRLKMMDKIRNELDTCRHKMSKAAERLDQELCDVLSCASLLLDLEQVQDPPASSAISAPPSTLDGRMSFPQIPDRFTPSTMCSTSAPEHKRKVGNMHQMKEELMRRKKKGKLPAGATEALKSWWDQNREWPYPTEEQKRRLLESTGLNTQQLNNWFINQRKRHWHKIPGSGSHVTRGHSSSQPSLQTSSGSNPCSLEEYCMNCDSHRSI